MNPARIIREKCPECDYHVLHEIKVSFRYEWYCPACGLVVWTAGQQIYQKENDFFPLYNKQMWKKNKIAIYYRYKNDIILTIKTAELLK